MAHNWEEYVEKMTVEQLTNTLILAIGVLSKTINFSDKTPEQILGWLYFCAVILDDSCYGTYASFGGNNVRNEG